MRGMSMEPDKLKFVRLHFMDWFNPHFAKNRIFGSGGKILSLNLEMFILLLYAKKSHFIYEMKISENSYLVGLLAEFGKV